jgi:hypothetical protein
MQVKTPTRKLLLVLLSALFSAPVLGELTALNDDELSDVSGRESLIAIDKYDYEGNNFYQIKVNSVVETSVNIDHLLLNDGGGSAQIDIEDLSISGGINNQVSSAILTNPFVEFAFAGSIDGTDARDREIVGIRLGADEMQGVMSFGQQNTSILGSNGGPDANFDTGINMFSGYMRTNTLSGVANTNAFSDDGFQLDARLIVAGIFNGTLNMPDATVSFPAQQALFTTPAIVVNGSYISDVDIITDLITLNDVTYSATGQGVANVCLLSIPFVGCVAPITIRPNVTATGEIDNIKARGFITQDLKTIHKASVDDGFYLSAQNRAVNWRGSEGDDVAQPGWWMAFNGEVYVEPLTLDSVDLPRTTVESILLEVSTVLQTTDPVRLDIGEVFDGFAGNVDKTINVTLPNSPFESPMGNQNPAPLVLGNQHLGSTQAPIVNCWNSTIGC